jgi:hypothetical protein
MTNSALILGGEAFGGMENEDPASALQTHLEAMFDDDLEQAVIAMKRLVDASTAQLLIMIGELDSRQIPQNEHILSTKQWLKHFTRMSSTEASGTLKTARALTEMPQVREAAAQGNIVPNAVRLLTQARDRHPDEFCDHEAVFTDAATYLDTTDLRRAISHWEQQVDHPGALEDTDTARQRRRFFFNKTYLGMWSATGDLDPESGHVIATALRSHTDPVNLDPDDRRTMPQRTADALVDICRYWLDHNTDTAITGGERPHITVTIPYATLTGDAQRLGEIDGSAVDPETIRRLACDAGIVRIVLDGESQPLDIGRRTRTVPPAIRRALELRDGGCAWAGCDAPASWCDAHHIIHWIDGGVTALINLILLCRKHHTAIHDGRRPPEP